MAQGYVGAGLVAVDKYVNNEPSGGLRDVGNAKSFSVTPNATTLQQKSFMPDSYGQVLDSVTVNAEHTVQMTLSNYTLENLELAKLGTIVTTTQGAAEAAEVALTARPGKWQRVGYRKCTSIAVTGMTLGTHYLVDLFYGLIQFLEGEAAPFVSDGDSVTAIVSAAGVSYRSLYCGDSPGIKCALQMRGKNMNTQQYSEVEIPKMSLKPSGGISYIGEDFGDLTLEGTIELKDGESAPYYVHEMGVKS